MINKIIEYIQPFTKVGINRMDAQLMCLFVTAVDGVINELKSNPVTKEEGYRLLPYSPFFANMVAITSYKTTDQWLEVFSDDPIKLMFLYSVYNNKKIDPKQFFDYDVKLASLWFGQYPLSIIGCLDTQFQSKVEEHYQSMDSRCVFLPQSTHAYFWSDYFKPEICKAVKRQYNASVYPFELDNIPNPNHIAIVTGFWKPTHAVFKAVGSFVYELAKYYKLTLIHLGELHKDADLSIFNSVSIISIKDGKLDLSELTATTFGATVFLDVGLTAESIYLSNTKLAPIQFSCNGHPVSGQGNAIDYFISGFSVESMGSRTQYSEYLLSIPGSGITICPPQYQRRNPVKDSRIRVAIPWSAIKYDASMCNCLRRLQEYGAHLVFIPGSPIHRFQASIPLRLRMYDYFGSDITIVPNLPYEEYMKLLESCHFAVDSYPFGGYNTVLESLWCGLPVVTRQGSYWHNRVASFLLHRVKLDDLVAISDEHYFETARSLILDGEKLQQMSKKVNEIDFDALLKSTAMDCNNFVLTIQGILQKVYL